MEAGRPVRGQAVVQEQEDVTPCHGDSTGDEWSNRDIVLRQRQQVLLMG